MKKGMLGAGQVIRNNKGIRTRRKGYIQDKDKWNKGRTRDRDRRRVAGQVKI